MILGDTWPGQLPDTLLLIACGLGQSRDCDSLITRYPYASALPCLQIATSPAFQPNPPNPQSSSLHIGINKAM